MIKFLLKYFFKFSGWKVTGGIPSEIKHCIIIVAPHTSNWDFIYGIGSLGWLHIDIKYLAKKELFLFPFKKFFTSLGGIPVDRAKKNSLVDQVVLMFKEMEMLYVVFPPEGTRKKNAKWKTGFYYAAVKAGVPIFFSFIDYPSKTAGIGPHFYPTGNKEEDFDKIRAFYKNVVGKNPDNFSLPERS
jgi:1-acyl-sn-glycerol-3-phosphate acyltransferase